MKIALLGGAFNPPHLGHLMIARQVLDYTDASHVWMLPNYGQHPPKPVADVAHRLAMTRMFENDNISVSTLEIDHKLDGQTIHLLPHLPKEHEYVFVIGSDQLPSFHLWGQWQQLLQEIPFWIFPRYGYPIEPLYEGMEVIRSDMLICTDISSTKIRQRAKQGLPVDVFVGDNVAKYINTYKLYQ